MRIWLLVVLVACGSKNDDAKKDDGKRVDKRPPAEHHDKLEPAKTAEKPDASGSLPALAATAPDGKAYFALEKHGVMVLDDAAFTHGPSLPDEHDKYMRTFVRGAGASLIVEAVGSIYKIEGGKAAFVTKEGEGLLGPELVPASDGSLWAWTISTVSHYDGKAWHGTKNDELGKGGFVGFAVAGDGTAWLAAHQQLFRAEGDKWTPVDRPALAKELLGPLVTATDGKVYVLTSRALVDISAADAKPIALPGYAIGVTLAAGPEGRIAMVGMHGDVMVLVPPATLVTVTSKESGGSGRHAVAYDGAGRIWVGGASGLVVYDATGKPTRYEAGTLPDLAGKLGAIVVDGGGPKLPPVGEVARGRVKGSLATQGGKVIADATVEICAKTSAMLRAGETPCKGEPFTKSTKSDADGGFVFEDVPVGTWSFAVLVPGRDKWSVTMSDYCSDMKKGETCSAHIALRDK